MLVNSMTISRKILHTFPTRHPAMQGAECELFCSLSLYSPYSHWLEMWTTRPLYFDAKVVSFLVTIPLFPFPSSSLFLVCCSNLKFWGWLLSFSRDFHIPDQVWWCDTEQSGKLSCELPCLGKPPASSENEFSFLNFKRPLIFGLLHVELSVPLWH